MWFSPKHCPSQYPLQRPTNVSVLLSKSLIFQRFSKVPDPLRPNWPVPVSFSVQHNKLCPENWAFHNEHLPILVPSFFAILGKLPNAIRSSIRVHFCVLRFRGRFLH